MEAWPSFVPSLTAVVPAAALFVSATAAPPAPSSWSDSASRESKKLSRSSLAALSGAAIAALSPTASVFLGASLSNSLNISSTSNSPKSKKPSPTLSLPASPTWMFAESSGDSPARSFSPTLSRVLGYPPLACVEDAFGTAGTRLVPLLVTAFKVFREEPCFSTVGSSFHPLGSSSSCTCHRKTRERCGSRMLELAAVWCR
mmetsp:Transcript_108283/g.305242  ORF Transcript_108283/g.305242 Transcript_108283/m.305242 type:complete len:201 (+) Transcript_108283:76-678(+)